jgi:hypothetical protein
MPVYESDGESAAAHIVFPAPAQIVAATGAAAGGYHSVAPSGGVGRQMDLSPRQEGWAGTAQGALAGATGGHGRVVLGSGVPYGARVSFGAPGSTPPLTPPTPQGIGGFTPPQSWTHGDPCSHVGPNTASLYSSDVPGSRQLQNFSTGAFISALPGQATTGSHGMHAPARGYRGPAASESSQNTSAVRSMFGLQGVKDQGILRDLIASRTLCCCAC